MITQLLARTAALYLTGAPLLSGKNILIQQKPLAEKKLKTVRQMKRRSAFSHNAPLPGDVIYVKRMGDLYRHYGIYAGHNRVIHYAGRGGDWGDDVSIHDAPMHEFLQELL